MRRNRLIRRASLALAFAVTGCTITTGSSDSCSPDSTVAGCVQGSSGYSCTGAATPEQSSPSLNCSTGVANAGSTLYCCIVGTGTSCAPDTTVANCAGGSQGYSCTGSDTPPESDSALSCGAGIPGNAGSTLYCCTTGGADGGGICTPDTTVANCMGPSIGYSCTGANSPPQSNSSLNCGPGAPGDAGSTLYCCTSNATGAEGGNDGGGESGSDAVSDSGNDALNDSGLETGVDSGICAVGADTGSPSCDQCIDSLCCPALVACGSPDAAGVDDAGATACEQLIQCTLDCRAGNPDAGVDGGSLSDCETICNPSYTVSEQQNANALLQCQATSCTQQCQ
jgi:hypothetical protein